MSRYISDRGLAVLESCEELRTQAYDDATGKPLKTGEVSKGIPTIGYGRTLNVKAGDTCTREQAVAWLKDYLYAECAAVDKAVKVDLTENEFDALVMFAYNVGTGEFLKSTLLKVLNAGKYDQVPAQLMRWTKQQGVVKPGLVHRRQKEVDLWVNGAAPPSAVSGVLPPAAPAVVQGASASENVDTPHAGHAATIAGIGLAGVASALSDVTAQLQPFAGDSHIVAHVCTALAVAGAVLSITLRLSTLKKEGV